jgi:hypothetical protein
MAFLDLIKNEPTLERELFGYCTYNNRAFICGGDSSTYGVLGDVWSSPDGVNWTHTNPGSPILPARDSHVMLEHNGALFVLGGYTSGNIYTNDVWRSYDGTIWTRIASGSSSFTVRDDFAAVSFDGRIWVMGGDDNAVGGNWWSDVWNSPDGVHWTQVTNNEPSAAYTNMGFGVINNRMVLIGGYDGNNQTYTNTIRYTDDGINWRVSPDTLVTADAYMAVAKFNDMLVSVGGTQDGTQVYFSKDGVRWKNFADTSIDMDSHGLIALKNPNRLICLLGDQGTPNPADDAIYECVGELQERQIW